MKKLFVLLLALTCAGVAFAQDAAPAMTFGMYGDITATLFNNDSKTGYGVYSETYFGYKQKDMAFAATTIGGADFFAAPRNYSFSYTLMADLNLKVLAGKLREAGGVRLTSYIDGNGLSTRFANVQEGVAITAAPVPGLAVAVFMPMAGGKADVDYVASSIGVSYTLTDLAQIVAGYRLGSPTKDTKELWASVGVLAVKDVTARLGFRMVDTTSLPGGKSTPYVYVTGGTKMGDLDVGLDADVVLASEMGYGVKVYGQYTMGSLDVGAEVSFDNGKDQWYAVDGVKVNPYLQFNVSKGDIIVGFVYNTKSSSWSLPIDFEISF